MTLTEAVKEREAKLRKTVEKGREDFGERMSEAKVKTREAMDARAHEVGDALGKVSVALRKASDSIENAGTTLGRHGEAAAERVDRASTYLTKNDVGVFVEDLESFGRRHVGWAVGTAFVAGWLFAKLLAPGRRVG